MLVPCPHKFADYLYLDRLDFSPATLIVGTFNPGWDNLGNYAQWFYGRTQNNYFWDVLPRLYAQPSLKQASAAEWKAFCRTHRIALTDLIYSIEDADHDNPEHVRQLKSYRDDILINYFKRINWVDIPRILEDHPGIERVFLTRSSSSKWRQQWRKVENYCCIRHIHCRALLTPSGGARFQLPKSAAVTLGEYILGQWRLNWNLNNIKSS